MEGADILGLDAVEQEFVFIVNVEESVGREGDGCMGSTAPFCNSSMYL